MESNTVLLKHSRKKVLSSFELQKKYTIEISKLVLF